MTPCPYCHRQPIVERCEPWPRGAGPAPWHVGCYQGGSNEHYVGANGDTKHEAVAGWERECAATLRLPLASLRAEGTAVHRDGAWDDE